jgi:hypothetical protein
MRVKQSLYSSQKTKSLLKNAPPIPRRKNYSGQIAAILRGRVKKSGAIDNRFLFFYNFP